MRIKIIFEYDGSNFSGYQKQPNGISVQETLEKAILLALKEQISIVASGRTDAGVSAMCQVAHFDTTTSIPANKICYAINTFLPDEIRVKDSCEVSDSFHARFSAKKKTYVYQMYKGKFISPIRRKTHARVDENINVESMRSQLCYLVGEHDFCSFMSSGGDVKSTVRTVYSAELACRGDEIIFTICGNGFLYNMVRIIVGTLIEIGMGKAHNIPDIIAAKDRKKAGATAKPEGLMLCSVDI